MAQCTLLPRLRARHRRVPATDQFLACAHVRICRRCRVTTAVSETATDRCAGKKTRAPQVATTGDRISSRFIFRLGCGGKIGIWKCAAASRNHFHQLSVATYREPVNYLNALVRGEAQSKGITLHNKAFSRPIKALYGPNPSTCTFEGDRDRHRERQTERESLLGR